MQTPNECISKGSMKWAPLVCRSRNVQVRKCRNPTWENLIEVLVNIIISKHLKNYYYMWPCCFIISIYPLTHCICHNLTICSMTQFYKLLNVTVYASKVIRNMWWKKYLNECTAHWKTVFELCLVTSPPVVICASEVNCGKHQGSGLILCDRL